MHPYEIFYFLKILLTYIFHYNLKEVPMQTETSFKPSNYTNPCACLAATVPG